MTNATEPAHPCTHTIFGDKWEYTGLSKLEHTAILLGVPQSGDEQIDAMIRAANRRNIAAQIMAGLIISTTYGATSPLRTAIDAIDHAEWLIIRLEKPRERERHAHHERG